jgi:hypothetical protein
MFYKRGRCETKNPFVCFKIGRQRFAADIPSQKNWSGKFLKSLGTSQTRLDFSRYCLIFGQQFFGFAAMAFAYETKRNAIALRRNVEILFYWPVF